MDKNTESEKLKKLVLKIVKGIIAKEENFSPEDIENDMHLLDHYGIDSLYYIAKVMALEEYFDVDIDDGDLENLTTVSQLTDFIISKSAQETLEKIKSETDVNQALLDINPNDTNSVKQIRHILTTSFFSSLHSDLGLQVNSVFILLTKMLRNSRIEHISTIPRYIDNKLQKVFIVFLTKKQLYYIGFASQLVEIKEILLSNLSVELKCFFEKNGIISNLEITCDVGEFHDDGKPRKYQFNINDEFTDITLKLIGKINKFKEGCYEK
jgi:acyl carrier protein